MIRTYGPMYRCDFPHPSTVLETLDVGEIAHAKDMATEYDYIITKELKTWTLVDNLGHLLVKQIDNEGEWIMAVDDFENGWGEQNYPHCSKCNRGVYRHDAGSWCPFCGTAMRNPMR